MRTQRERIILATLIGATLAVTAPQAALAATNACQPINNTATVDYYVGGSQQAQKSSSATFKVGNKINLSVQRVDNAYVSVSPGQTDAYLYYKITNNGNAYQKYKLTSGDSAALPTGWATADNYDATATAIEIQSAVNKAYNDGTTSYATVASDITPNALAPGDYINVRVKSTIPTYPAGAPVANTGYNDGDVSAKYLQAQTFDPSATPAVVGLNDSPVYYNSGTTCTNAEGAFNVFADPKGTDDTTAAYDGKASDLDAYKTGSPNLSIAKASVVCSDPVTGSSVACGGSVSPRAIPDAVVLYTITLTNSGSVDAINVNIADTLDTNLNFVTKFKAAIKDCTGEASDSGIVIEDSSDSSTTCYTNANDATTPKVDFTGGTLHAGTSTGATAITVKAGKTVKINYQATIK